MTSIKNITADKGSKTLRCPVCGEPLSIRIAKGRKSGKPFLMVLCLKDGRHFRGFIGEQIYVRQVIDRLEVNEQSSEE